MLPRDPSPTLLSRPSTAVGRNPQFGKRWFRRTHVIAERLHKNRWRLLVTALACHGRAQYVMRRVCMYTLLNLIVARWQQALCCYISTMRCYRMFTREGCIEWRLYSLRIGEEIGAQSPNRGIDIFIAIFKSMQPDGRYIICVMLEGRYTYLSSIAYFVYVYYSPKLWMFTVFCAPRVTFKLAQRVPSTHRIGGPGCIIREVCV